MKKITPRQIKKIHTLVSRLGMNEEAYRDMLEASWGVRSSKELAEPEAELLIGTLEAKAVEMGVWQKPYVKKYDELAAREGSYATPAQLRLIEALWAQVSRAPDAEGRRRTLQKFLQNRFKVDNSRCLDRPTAARVIYALRKMVENAKDKR